MRRFRKPTIEDHGIGASVSHLGGSPRGGFTDDLEQSDCGQRQHAVGVQVAARPAVHERQQFMTWSRMCRSLTDGSCRDILGLRLAHYRIAKVAAQRRRVRRSTRHPTILLVSSCMAKKASPGSNSTSTSMSLCGPKSARAADPKTAMRRMPSATAERGQGRDRRERSASG